MIRPGSPRARALRPGNGLVDVELTWIEGRFEQQVRFGRVAAERVIDAHKRIVSFYEGATFCLLEYRSCDRGQVGWRLDVLVATVAGSSSSSLFGDAHGAEILLSVVEVPLIQAVLREIDLIEAAGIDACDAAPDHWRHVDAQLVAAAPFRPYSAERHAAWLRRQEVER
jgi:hypothetical protein